jgi:hypothetical protein
MMALNPAEERGFLSRVIILAIPARIVWPFHTIGEVKKLRIAARSADSCRLQPVDSAGGNRTGYLRSWQSEQQAHPR